MDRKNVLSGDPLPNSFLWESRPGPRIETAYRRIITDLPAPQTRPVLERGAQQMAAVSCYQPPIVWDRAEGFQVFDVAGNRWIDFSSTAVMTNVGHGHPRIREAIQKAAATGLLAQFSFASEVRAELAEAILSIAPPQCDRVLFWTVGSEAIECALRLARERGRTIRPSKRTVLTHAGDYHGWTLGAHQLSGDSAVKPWLPEADSQIGHLPFPHGVTEEDGAAFFRDSIRQALQQGIVSDDVAAIFIETFQGWGALPFPVSYMRELREWSDRHDVLVVFDEVQTGFGRTGRWFAHEHYGIAADLICVGKGLTSSLPLAAVLGRSAVIDQLPPGEITTTHAAHPLSCAAALENLAILKEEGLVERAAESGPYVEGRLKELQNRFPECIADVRGRGLLYAVHLSDVNGDPDLGLARDLTWATVQHGVMVFHTNRPTLKICPPLSIPVDALEEGLDAVHDALTSLLRNRQPSH